MWRPSPRASRTLSRITVAGRFDCRDLWARDRANLQDLLTPTITLVLVMESITEFRINLSWIVPVETAEGLAVVEFHAAVGDVDAVDRCGESLAEVFAQGKIERGVLWKVIAGIGLPGERITEAGAVIDVGGGVRVPGQCDFATDVESVTLVVIEREKRARGRKIGEPAGNG